MNLKLIILNLLLIHLAYGRKHHLEIRDDYRRYIALSTFGFYKGGILNAKFSHFVIPTENEDNLFGFSLDKTQTDAMSPYLDTHQTKCILEESAAKQINGPIAYFILDVKTHMVRVECSKDWQTHLYNSTYRGKRHSHRNTFIMQPQKRDTFPQEENNVEADYAGLPNTPCNELKIPLTKEVQKDGTHTYTMNFSMLVATLPEEGLYNLYFHACPNYYNTPFGLNFNMDVEEKNIENFLSAEEIPLPALYSMMSLLFFFSGVFWVYILTKSKHSVFKIHYLMAVLVFLKALSLMFHAINYHFIEIRGAHVETWAILFYIAHLLKGAVLFITIVLIGTGWTFIKHILADRDKKLFMIVIPLQVLANIAKIIIEESEEGTSEHKTWNDIFILVDLLCCGAILFPVVWSIRHLQEASATDGKAAVNLRKLRLFRQFYIMIVCYIYFTRIIVYLLKITVPFQYGWLDEMFREMATYIFFVLTGYKFRPTYSHPYFQVDDSDDEEVEILTESGITTGLTKVTNRSQPSSTIVVENADERENLLNNRESSHEYD